MSVEKMGKFIHSWNKYIAEASAVPWHISVGALLISATAVERNSMKAQTHPQPWLPHQMCTTSSYSLFSDSGPSLIPWESVWPVLKLVATRYRSKQVPTSCPSGGQLWEAFYMLFRDVGGAKAPLPTVATLIMHPSMCFSS